MKNDRNKMRICKEILKKTENSYALHRIRRTDYTQSDAATATAAAVRTKLVFMKIFSVSNIKQIFYIQNFYYK